MLTLFSSSCYWSDRCFLDSNNGHWFEPRLYSALTSSSLVGGSGTGAAAAGGAAVSAGAGSAGGSAVWTGIGLGWLRAAVGRREWRLPCVDVNIRL